MFILFQDHEKIFYLLFISHNVKPKAVQSKCLLSDFTNELIEHIYRTMHCPWCCACSSLQNKQKSRALLALKFYWEETNGDQISCIVYPMVTNGKEKTF